MSTATLASPAVAAFAAAVRHALSDLPAEEIDELMDGLEADLTERIADGGSADLGDPVAYAEELRAAAGLPKPARSTSVPWTDLRALPARIATDARAFAARHSAVSAIWAFLVSLRPLWWVFRAAAVTALLFIVFGPSGWTPLAGSTLITFLAFLVISVQFGRGRWLPFRWMKGLLLAANIVLGIAAPFVIAGVATSVNNAWYSNNSAESYPDQSSTGLTLDGSPVSNVFAYDAQGKPLSDVQLFDQDGKPLNLVGDPTATADQDGYPVVIVPNQSVSGRLGWNVYPLTHVNASDLNDDGSIRQSVTPTPAVAPFALAKPLAGGDSGSADAPSPSPVAPSATPTPPAP
jgi:uncharacterized membrane protein